jgi:hypothetical protein
MAAITLSYVVSSPTATTIATIPVAAVSYVELVVSTDLDTSGGFKFFGEASVVVDSLSFDLTKAPFVDVFTVVDTASLNPGLVKSDFVSATTTITLGTTKGLGDSITSVEFLTAAVNKSVSDSAALVDTPSLYTTKPLVDVLYVDEQASFDLSTFATDSVSFSDSIHAVRIFERIYSDLVSTSDTPSWLFSTGFSDTVATADTFELEHSKLLTDGFGLNDLADVSDGLLVSFAQSIANVAFIADNPYKQTTKAKSDTIAVTDFGLIVTQDYCDLTYFAEDYVGSTRSF